MLKRSKVQLTESDFKGTCEEDLVDGRTEEVLLWIMYVVSRLQPGALGKVLSGQVGQLWKTVLVDR